MRRIQRPGTRSWLTALKLCDPPLTCMTASVLPYVGRTGAVRLSGIQSICAFMIADIAPWRSGEHQTMPSHQVTSSLNSRTFGCETSASSGSGSPGFCAEPFENACRLFAGKAAERAGADRAVEQKNSRLMCGADRRKQQALIWRMEQVAGKVRQRACLVRQPGSPRRRSATARLPCARGRTAYDQGDQAQFRLAGKAARLWACRRLAG